MKIIYDIIIIGAGSAGLATAQRAAAHNASVLLIEQSRIGGTCVNVGCVPKKLTYNLCHILELSRLKGYLNIDIELKPDFYKTFVEKREAFVSKLNNIYYTNIKNKKIDYIEGRAELLNGCVSVNGEKYNYKYCLLASGSQSVPLTFKDSNGTTIRVDDNIVRNSDDFFRLEEIPQRSVIIGSGYIGVELAFILKQLGSDVSIIARNDRLLSHFDDMLSDCVRKGMEKKGIKIYFKSNITDVTPTNIKFLHDAKPVEIEADFIMSAIGRDCDLSFIKPEIARNGNFLVVDDMFKTSIENVYAVGDIIGPNNMLTPVAIYCGRILADHLFSSPVKNLVKEYDVYNSIASVIFSHPPCGSVGISEKEARKMNGEVKVYNSSFRNLLYGVCEEEEKEVSCVKVVTVDGIVKGVHLFGFGFDEAIQLCSVAMKMNATFEQFKRVIAVHPTAAEEIVTIN